MGAAIMALAFGSTSVAHAQQRELFTWSGRVDQEVQLTMRGRQLSATAIGPREPGVRRTSVMSPLPRTDGEVSVQVVNGRGTVDVIQQPNAQNGYTATLRVRDPEGGVGNYRLNVYWQPMAAGEVGRPYGRVGRARGMDVGRRGRVALQWSGNVDDNLLIMLRPSGLSYRVVDGRQPTGIQSSFNGLPSGAAAVDVEQTEGRGSVSIVQQPSATNGYTAMIRVVDPQSGYGHYSFDVTWR
jgi:hypothetical protein